MFPIFYLTPPPKMAKSDKQTRKGTGSNKARSKSGAKAGGRKTQPKSSPRGGLAWSAKLKQWVPMAFLKKQADTAVRKGVEYTKTEALKYAERKTEEIIEEVRKARSKGGRTDQGEGSGFGGTGTAKKRTMSGSSLFRNPVLPLGTTMTSHIKMGRDAMPKSSVASTVVIPAYSSEGSIITDATIGSTDLRKSETGLLKRSSINQTYNELIPLCIPNLMERRLCLSQALTHTGSVAKTFTHVEDAFDQPVIDASDKEAENDMILNKYVPMNIRNVLTFQNVNKVLPCTVKLTFVQLKLADGTPNQDDNPQPLLATNIGAAAARVLEKVVSFDQSHYQMPTGTDIGPGTSFNKGALNMRWPTITGSNAEVWGVNPSDGYHSICWATRAGRSFKNCSAFEQNFNVLKTSTFKIGAGNSLEVDFKCHYNKCFNKIGNAGQMATNNTFASGADYYSQEQCLVLMEITGQPGQSFYEYQVGSAVNNITRTWATGHSSANVSFKMKTYYELPIKTDIDADGLYDNPQITVFSRDYVDFPATKEVGMAPIPQLDQLETEEPTTPVVNTRMYIQPVESASVTSGSGVRTSN